MFDCVFGFPWLKQSGSTAVYELDRIHALACKEFLLWYFELALTHSARERLLVDRAV